MNKCQQCKNFEKDTLDITMGFCAKWVKWVYRTACCKTYFEKKESKSE